MRCPEECGKQWRPEQEKPDWQKQREEEAKEEAGRKWKEQEVRRKKRRKTVEVKSILCREKRWKEKDGLRL